jgi:hypothetical protein
MEKKLWVRQLDTPRRNGRTADFDHSAQRIWTKAFLNKSNYLEGSIFFSTEKMQMQSPSLSTLALVAARETAE